DANKRTNAPRSAAQYLSGLLYCEECGAPMRTGSLRRETKLPRKDGYTGARYEYFCGSWHKARGEGKDEKSKKLLAQLKEECKCKRNGIFQDAIEGFIDRYLEESGKRMELLTHGLPPDGQFAIPSPQLLAIKTGDEAEWEAMVANDP